MFYMKLILKHIARITLIILLLFLMSSCADYDDSCYITKTGTHYHQSGCRYLARSKIKIDCEKARLDGYAPCSVCKP